MAQSLDLDSLLDGQALDRLRSGDGVVRDASRVVVRGGEEGALQVAVVLHRRRPDFDEVSDLLQDGVLLQQRVEIDRQIRGEAPMRARGRVVYAVKRDVLNVPLHQRLLFEAFFALAVGSMDVRRARRGAWEGAAILLAFVVNDSGAIRARATLWQAVRNRLLPRVLH